MARVFPNNPCTGLNGRGCGNTQFVPAITTRAWVCSICHKILNEADRENWTAGRYDNYIKRLEAQKEKP